MAVGTVLVTTQADWLQSEIHWWWARMCVDALSCLAMGGAWVEVCVAGVEDGVVAIVVVCC